MRDEKEGRKKHARSNKQHVQYINHWLLTIGYCRSKLNDLFYSPQVRRLLSSSDEGCVGVWDLDTQREEVAMCLIVIYNLHV